MSSGVSSSLVQATRTMMGMRKMAPGFVGGAHRQFSSHSNRSFLRMTSCTRQGGLSGSMSRAVMRARPDGAIARACVRANICAHCLFVSRMLYLHFLDCVQSLYPTWSINISRSNPVPKQQRARTRTCGTRRDRDTDSSGQRDVASVSNMASGALWQGGVSKCERAFTQTKKYQCIYPSSQPNMHMCIFMTGCDHSKYDSDLWTPELVVCILWEQQSKRSSS